MFQILLESAWAASIVPFSSEATTLAMKAFGGFDMKLPFILSVIGASLGQGFNWLAGWLLIHSKAAGTKRINPARYARLASYFTRYGIFLLLFCWAPLCNLLVVLAGFLAIPARIVMPLVILGEAVHYAMILL